MNVYEKIIADELNKIAGREIYFKPEEIIKEPDGIADDIIGRLVFRACRPTHIMPISIARNCLKQFPTDWVSSKIKLTAPSSIDINDDWDYRRLLELSEIISSDLLEWAIKLGKNSENPDILEAVSDFNERSQTKQGGAV